MSFSIPLPKQQLPAVCEAHSLYPEYANLVPPCSEQVHLFDHEVTGCLPQLCVSWPAAEEQSTGQLVSIGFLFFTVDKFFKKLDNNRCLSGIVTLISVSNGVWFVAILWVFVSKHYFKINVCLRIVSSYLRTWGRSLIVSDASYVFDQAFCLLVLCH